MVIRSGASRARSVRTALQCGRAALNVARRHLILLLWQLPMRLVAGERESSEPAEPPGMIRRWPRFGDHRRQCVCGPRSRPTRKIRPRRSGRPRCTPASTAPAGGPPWAPLPPPLVSRAPAAAPDLRGARCSAPPPGHERLPGRPPSPCSLDAQHGQPVRSARGSDGGPRPGQIGWPPQTSVGALQPSGPALQQRLRHAVGGPAVLRAALPARRSLEALQRSLHQRRSLQGAARPAQPRPAPPRPSPGKAFLRLYSGQPQLPDTSSGRSPHPS